MIKKRFLSMLVLLAAVVTGARAQWTPSITIDPDFLTLDAEMHYGDDFLPLTYENMAVENGQNFFLQFYTAEGEEIETQTSQMGTGPAYYATTSPWCFAMVDRNTGNDGFQVTVATYPNDYGVARSVYFKVYAYQYAYHTDSPLVYSNLVTVTQAPPGTPTDYDVTANLANGAYWATFYSNAGNYQAPVGTQVFAVNLDGTTITMIPVEDRIVKSGEGVVLKQATESSEPTTTTINMTLTATAATDSYFSGNSLLGTMTEINTTGANDYYVLGGKNGAGFYKLSNTSGTIGVNKAYLTYSGGGAPAARGFFLFDETTGIEIPTAESNDFDGTVYDLQGRRVAQPTKGLYIVNGKKVFINK